MLVKKIKKYNKGKFEIRWDMLRNKDQFKILMGLIEKWGLMRYTEALNITTLQEPGLCVFIRTIGIHNFS